jgi:hypothetical protein
MACADGVLDDAWGRTICGIFVVLSVIGDEPRGRIGHWIIGPQRTTQKATITWWEEWPGADGVLDDT